MQKISNWSLVGYLGGIVFMIISIIRYQLMFPWIQPDTDKTIAYVLIGLCICGIAWLYNKQKMQGHTLDTLENYIADKNFEEKRGK